MRYYFGGLRLDAAVPLDGLRQAPPGAAAYRAAFTIDVTRGAMPVADTILYRWVGRYGLTLGRSAGEWLFASALDGAFLIDPEQARIRCIVADPAGRAWRDVLVRRVLPRVAILAGAAALHAAAVASDARAILLLGASGAGKSTLCAMLGTVGWDVLSEDISLLWEAGAPHVAPTTTGTCLWDDSRAALGLAAARWTPLAGYDGKSHCQADQQGGVAPVPLAALVFVQRAPDAAAPKLQRLRAAEALIRAAQQRVRFNPGDDSGREALDLFARLRAIVRVTPCYRLTYRGDYAALGTVEPVLRGLLRA